MFLFDITAEFNKQISELFKNNPNVCKFLLQHERKNIAIENICNQVIRYEHKFKSGINLRQRNEVIKEGVRLFSAAALEKKRQDLMTDAEKDSEIRKHNKIDELQTEVKEHCHGQTWTENKTD